MPERSSDYSFEPILIPSGTFVYRTDDGVVEPQIQSLVNFHAEDSPIRVEGFELCNPMPLLEPEKVLRDVGPPGTLPELQQAYRVSAAQVITEAQLIDYAQAVVNVGKAVRADRYQLIFVPLRGGLKPGTQLEVILKYSVRVEWLPYTGGSTGRNDELLIRILRDALEELAKEQSQLRIAVVDTAIGGHGAAHLAELMLAAASVVDASGIEVTFHLIHPRERHPARAEGISSLTAPSIALNVVFHPVESLLVEDWSEAIGIRIVPDDDAGLLIKKACTEGRVIIRDAEAVRVVDSEELQNVVDAYIARFVNLDILTDPKAAWHRDVWQDYFVR